MLIKLRKNLNKQKHTIFIWKCKEPTVAKKKKLSIKLEYKTRAIKAVWQWHPDKETSVTK